MTAHSPAEIAAVCHEANRVLQVIQGDPTIGVSPHWDDASDADRESSIEGVWQALAGATPEELHESWCAFKTAAGWVRGPIKDAEAKTHPSLAPYADLPASQRLKDRVFHAIVEAMSTAS